MEGRKSTLEQRNSVSWKPHWISSRKRWKVQANVSREESRYDKRAATHKTIAGPSLGAGYRQSKKREKSFTCSCF